MVSREMLSIRGEGLLERVMEREREGKRIRGQLSHLVSGEQPWLASPIYNWAYPTYNWLMG